MSWLRCLSAIAVLVFATVVIVDSQSRPSAGPQTPQPPAAKTASNPNPTSAAESRVNAPLKDKFPEGQTYTYGVDWRLLTAGVTIARFDTVNGERHVVVEADSTGAVALLYHVHDRLETFFNPQSNCALSLIKHTEEGFRRVETSVRYDYSRKRAILDERNIRAKNQKHEENDIPSCVTNTVSAALYVGTQPLQPGTRFVFPSSDGGKAADIEVTVEGQEKVKAASTSYNTIRVSAQALNGPQKGKGKIWIWYSDDERRVAVQMRLRAFWGTVTFHLLQIGNTTTEKAGE
ncbi:MAG TPA: DUF3108 domain-containing protein [Terriglobales bacterium]|nr:DUF3108 domain-containing protein [Terriglobales bacterium]